MTCCSLITLVAAVLVLGATPPRDANAQSAIIEGMARAEDGTVPIAFALVRLVSADSGKVASDTPMQGITNASGRYRFSGVLPGRYRVQLMRIGFQPALSDPVQVAAGETAELAIRVESRPVVLPPIAVTADVCVTAKDLKAHPQIQMLWQQARDGASVRTELMARFRYEVLTHEETIERKTNGTPVGVVDQHHVSDPKWAVRNAARSRTQRQDRGYYGPTKGADVAFYVPNELEVLHEDFLKAHCLVAAPERGNGEVGLRFQPLRTRRNFLDVGGTIWLDSVTYLARRIDLAYVDGDDARGSVRLDFGDVPVAGGTLRMPVGGDINLRSSRKDPARRAESKFTITYTGFEEVRP